MSNPWLSVIMPTYNGAEYLPQALASLRASAHSGLELVAVDDGSTDETVDLLKEYGRDHRLELIRQGHGGNWVASSNRGLAAARGEYACFLHQDDAWLPGRLGTLRPLTAAYPGATLFVHSVQFIGPGGERLGQWRCPLRSSRGPIPAGLVVRKLLVQNCFAVPAPLFRRRDVAAAGGMDERLWYTADWDLWLKLAASGETVYHPRPLAAFRLHPWSQTARRTSDVTEMRWQLETVLNRHLPGLRGSPRFAGIESAARLSVECNLWLAACRRRPISPSPLLWAAAAAGPSGFFRYLFDSGIIGRVAARLRLALLASMGPNWETASIPKRKGICLFDSTPV
jgi:GT2 family glycosyltransferase